MGRRVRRLQRQLADPRGQRVVLLSHCLLNQNVRYLGGAGRAGGFREVVDDYLDRGVGVHQMPCPEMRVWGGVLKRRMLVAYGSGAVRGPVARALLGVFIRFTSLRYARLARATVHDVTDYRRSGVEVVGVVGVADSPSCGVHTTLDLCGALGVLTRCPLARLDADTFNNEVVDANVVPGEGLYVHALRRRLAEVGAPLPFAEHTTLGPPNHAGPGGGVG